MSNIVKDKVAIVTGAGGDLGSAMAALLAQEGAKVLVSDIDDVAGEKSVTAIRANGGIAEFRMCDVTRGEDFASLVETAESLYGPLSILVNNAGLPGVVEPITEYSDEVFDQMVAVNLRGVYLGTKHGGAAMLSSGVAGSIINISSVAGLISLPEIGIYSMTKHGVIGLTKGAAMDLAPAGIRVNAVCPGFVNSRMADISAARLGVDAQEGIGSSLPIGRLGEPEEIAELVLWLASDRSSFCTGSYYTADGGQTAQ